MSPRSGAPAALARLLGWAGLIVGLPIALTPLPASVKAPASDADLVVLPTLVVQAESMEFAGWSKTISPHFVVYSDHDASEVSAILLHLEKLKAALDKLAGLPTGPDASMVFIYPSHGSDWTKLESLENAVSKLCATRGVTMIEAGCVLKDVAAPLKDGELNDAGLGGLAKVSVEAIKHLDTYLVGHR